MKIFSNTLNSLENAINYSSMKQKTIANNIANVDTPNYKAKDVKFSQSLTNEMQKLDAYKSDHRHVDFSSTKSQFNVYTKTNSTYQQNGNNVDIDQEMANMAKNQIHFNALVDRISGKYTSLKTVIQGGR
ncbi:flagellar basal body rod protein FlgB [Metabacillus herbersteinensis]|uniref:Flagellar basal body rod protein FlgB n=1 Tax=Metabacillus herbersteinensis TaxID=283816 RepID=A0ABV6GCS6_9BACI